MSLSLSEINDMRQRCIAGDTPSDDEIAAAVDALRADRLTAKASARKSSAKAAPVSLMDLAVGGNDDEEE